MGVYNDNIEWEPDRMTHMIPPTTDNPARIGWVAMGITDTAFARQFAADLLKKCDIVDNMNQAVDSSAS